MKKVLLLLLVLALVAVPVAAAGGYVTDESGLLTDAQASELEQLFTQNRIDNGFSIAVITTDSFGGSSAKSFANAIYDLGDYGEDGILLLVSLEMGEWYILTSGLCAQRISDAHAEAIGEEVVELIRDERYYEAFRAYGAACVEAMELSPSYDDTNPEEDPYIPQKDHPPILKTIAICLVIGLVAGGITVAVMAAKMRTVRQKNHAADYVVPGSMQLHHSRDIYLYSTLHRTPRPKNNSSGGGGGGSRGGAGGRI